MKKYKLIKIYPKSAPLDTCVVFDGLMYVNGPDEYSKESIENFPEFWEEVVEKDYELLDVSFLYNPEKRIIHKVKRLLDGEVFAIGDKCHLNNGNGNNNPILRFEIKNENWGLERYRNRDRIVVFLETIHKTEWGPIELDSLVKSKQPLFKTVDGVNIFENDLIYWINLFTLDGVNCNKYDDNIGECDLKDGLISLEDFNKSDKSQDISFLGFSTKGSAEKYLLENKPCLSLNDVKKASLQDKNIKFEFLYMLEENLRNLIKQKLKND